MALDLSNPTVKLFGIGALSLAALLVLAPAFGGDETSAARSDTGKRTKKEMAEARADVRADAAAIRREDKKIRALNKIIRTQDALDDRFMRIHDQRKQAEDRADEAKSPRAKKAALSRVNKLRDREDIIHRQADRLEDRYQGIQSGAIRVNPDDSPLVAKAFEESQEFHGNKGEVVELSPKDRYISPVGVVLGRLVAITYSVPNDSQRRGAPFEHVTGDRGTWSPPAKQKPLVVADAKTGHIHLIQDRSPMVFDAERGMVG